MMPTIVMLSWEFPPTVVGGLSRHVHGLARELAAMGHPVHVLTPAAANRPAQESVDGVGVTRVHPYFQQPQDFRLWVCHLNYALLEAGVNLLRSIEGQVILHAHDWLVAYASRGLKHLFRLPLVATVHATEHGRHHGIHDMGQQYINDVEWWLTYEAWRVIVCSQAMRDEVQQLFGLGADKVAVIPNGVDLPRVGVTQTRPSASNYRRSGEKLLFHVGRLVPEKGAAVLLEALPVLLRRHSVRLVVGGVGPFESELRSRTRRLGIEDRVDFTGWLDDAAVQALYQTADAAVVPSTYEPFGIVALEAMAAGVPLVVSAAGGLQEIIRHGENGLQAAPGDPIALADQIDRLLSRPQWARELANRARQEVVTRYSWRSVAETTAQLYREVHEAYRWSKWVPPASQEIIADSVSVLGRYTV